MLTRLRLPVICDRLDALLDEAARRELNLREVLAWMCTAAAPLRSKWPGDGAAAGAVPVLEQA
jgi:hypothetical protein